MLNWKGIKALVAVALMLVAVNSAMLALAPAAFADPAPLAPRGTCSNDPEFEINVGGGGGLISGIVLEMQSTLNTVTENMYNGIANNGTLQTTIRAAVILYIVIYGIAFTLGAVHASAADATIRCVKVMVVGVLTSSGSWGTFNFYFVNFFNNGVNELINVVTGIASNGMVFNVGPAFAPLDAAFSKIVSAKMLVTLWALISPFPPYAPTGPNGMLAGILILSGVTSFVRALLNAMWVYLMAMVLKALMFGVAPLFIPFVLFNRTRHLFDGWLNQVVNACLQPLMLFTFFSFFVVLVSVMVDKILGTPVCWTGWSESLRGSPFQQDWWRFAVPDGNGGFVPYGGIWNFTGAPQAGLAGFPLNIGMLMMFMMICELALRFNMVVIEIAKDISGAATNLSGMAGSISEWFTNNNPMAAQAKDSSAARPENLFKPPPADPSKAPGGGAPGAGKIFGAGGVFGKGALGSTKFKDLYLRPSSRGGPGAGRGGPGFGAPGANPAVAGNVGGVGVSNARLVGTRRPIRTPRRGELEAPPGTIAEQVRDGIKNLTGNR